MRTHKALQEDQGPTAGGESAQQEDEIYIRGENLTFEKVIPGIDGDENTRTEMWKISFVLMMRREGAQTDGMGGL